MTVPVPLSGGEPLSVVRMVRVWVGVEVAFSKLPLATNRRPVAESMSKMPAAFPAVMVYEERVSDEFASVAETMPTVWPLIAFSRMRKVAASILGA